MCLVAQRTVPVIAPAARRLVVDPQARPVGQAEGLPAGQASGMPSSSKGESTENEMTATEEERAKYCHGAAARPDASFATSGEQSSHPYDHKHYGGRRTGKADLTVVSDQPTWPERTWNGP